ncbi:ABC transporter ATP-binding protein [bacterium]|nr:ABC transporter ATP-binding protein [bacterium]
MTLNTHSTIKRNTLWLWRFWRPYRKWLGRIIVLSIFHAGVSIYVPFLYIAIIDGLKNNESIRSIQHDIGLLLLLGAGIFVLSSLLTAARARMNMVLEWDLRQYIFEHLLKMGPFFYNRFRTGDLVTRMTDDLGRKLSWFACSGIFRSFDSALRIVFSLIAMVLINPLLTLLTLLPLPLQFFTFIKTEGLLHKRFSSLQSQISRVSEIIESCFSGIRVVQAYTMEKMQIKKFKEAAADRAAAEVSAESAHIIIHSLYGYFWQFALIIVLLAGGWMVITDRMTLGEFVAFDYYIGLLIFPMFDIGNLMVSYRRASVSMDRVRDIEQSDPEIIEKEDARTLPICHGNIEFRHVSLTLGVHKVLNEISFTVKPGDIAAFAGPVGSGKSMIFNLLIRSYDPTSGSVTLDGVPLAEIKISELHRHIGYVSQEPVLFSKSIRDNIVFGRDNITDSDIDQALETAQILDDVRALPRGLDTQIGQRGLTLSGGQKQRLAMARALVTRPRILLLDDVTAALDADTEDALWEQLYTILPGTTCLVITHRPSTLEKANCIFVLEAGSIVETGPHAELMTKQGIYHRIYSRHKWQQELSQV